MVQISLLRDPGKMGLREVAAQDPLRSEFFKGRALPGGGVSGTLIGATVTPASAIGGCPSARQGFFRGGGGPEGGVGLMEEEEEQQLLTAESWDG